MPWNARERPTVNLAGGYSARVTTGMKSFGRAGVRCGGVPFPLRSRGWAGVRAGAAGLLPWLIALDRFIDSARACAWRARVRARVCCELVRNARPVCGRVGWRTPQQEGAALKPCRAASSSANKQHTCLSPRTGKKQGPVGHCNRHVLRQPSRH